MHNGLPAHARITKEIPMTLATTAYDREQAAQRALATKTNIPNSCQATTRGWVGAPSVGDYDGDGRADAEDGWKSEPAQYRHPGDRRPPRGTVVSYLGGSHDDGHRALSLGPIDGVWMIRSTDAAGLGHTATVPLDWPEKAWGLTYAGWSDTCDGYLIPEPPAPKPERPEPLTPEQKAKVIRRQARRADAAKHPGWAARLRAWAKRIGSK